MDALGDMARALGVPDPDAPPGEDVAALAGRVQLRGGRATLWVLARDGTGLDEDDRALARRRAAAFLLDRSTPGDLPLLLIHDRTARSIEIVLPMKRPGGPPATVRAVVPFSGPTPLQRGLVASLRAAPGEDARAVEARRRRAFDPESPARRLLSALKRFARDLPPATILARVTDAFRRAALGRPMPAGDGPVERTLAGVRLSGTESTVEDRSWDPDPELLGSLLRVLRDAEDRATRGAFYTPRWVARHLARRALDGYLKGRAAADVRTLAAIRAAAWDAARHPAAFTTRDRAERIRAAMSSFRVCDPAAGTGSLLVAMLQEMVLLQEGIARLREEAVTPAARGAFRRAIVAHTLFGIDPDRQALALCAARLSIAAAVPAGASAGAHLVCGDVLVAGAPGDGLPDAFDAVIANPPYVRQERLARAAKRALARRFDHVYRPKADLHIFFVARAAELLRDGGTLAIVTNGKFLKAGYGEGLRDHLARTLTITELIDLGDLPVFHAAAYPVLLSARRAPPPHGHRVAVADLPATLAGEGPEDGKGVSRRRGQEAIEAIASAVSRAAARRIPQARLHPSGWDLEGGDLVDLEKRWEREGRPLGEVVGGRMVRGVVTGLNAAFVIDGATRESLLTRDPRTAEIVHPWTRGRDVRPWRLHPSGLWLLFTHRGIDLARYPGACDHLAPFRARLTPRCGEGRESAGRKPGRYGWFEIQDRIGYADAFAEPKIVFSKFVTAPRFAWDESGAFTSNATGILPGAPAWLVALLQSDLLWRVLRRRLTRLQNGYWQLMNVNLLALPIVEPEPAERAALAGMVKRLASGAAPAGEARKLAARCEAIVRRTYGVGARSSVMITKAGR